MSDGRVSGEIEVNGRTVSVTFDATDSLLDVLRAHGHSEVKRGCARGECGSCLVLLNDTLVNSCQVFAATAVGARVITSVGLAEDPRAARIHESFAASGGVQCGYCTPGMVIATWWLLEHNDDPSESEIREALSGNLCRCTGYVKTIDAVKLAGRRMNGRE